MIRQRGLENARVADVAEEAGTSAPSGRARQLWLIPEGAQPWQSKLGEEFNLTLDKEGAYIYKCTPHVSAGMLGAIVVGELPPKNLDQIHAHPENKGMVGRAIRKLDEELKKKSG